MKGQVGIEFISIFFLVLLMFVFLQASNSTRFNSILDRSAQVAALNLLESTANMADLVGHSTAFQAKFDLPPFLPGGYNYSFTVSNRSMSVSWTDSVGPKSIIRWLNVLNATNSTSATSFTILPGTHFIQRTRSNVVIT